MCSTWIFVFNLCKLSACLIEESSWGRVADWCPQFHCRSHGTSKLEKIRSSNCKFGKNQVDCQLREKFKVSRNAIDYKMSETYAETYLSSFAESLFAFRFPGIAGIFVLVIWKHENQNLFTYSWEAHLTSCYELDLLNFLDLLWRERKRRKRMRNDFETTTTVASSGSVHSSVR